MQFERDDSKFKTVSLAVAWAGNSEGGPPGARAFATETGGYVPSVARATSPWPTLAQLAKRPTSVTNDFSTYSNVYLSVNGQCHLKLAGCIGSAANVAA